MRARVQDDGLITPEIGAWGEHKYKLVANYAQMFATAMKNKWDCRVYIDLFAGAGRSRIENTKKIVLASPLLVLAVPDKFDIHIFCEQEKEKIQALQARVSTAFPQAKAKFLQGDANKLTSSILQEIPSHRPGFKVLCFCFVDPFSLNNLAFDTIKELSSRFVDFLVLIPSGMDANRNLSLYKKPTNHTVDRFLGTSGWRQEWQKAESQGKSFGHFLTDCFGKQMAKLNYIYSGIEKAVQIRSTEKNLPLYHLAFFSRHNLGDKFWKETKKYSKNQSDLFE